MGGSGDDTFQGVMLHVDTNKLLALEQVKLHGEGTTDAFSLATIDKMILWSSRAHETGEGRILFVVDGDEVKTNNVKNLDTSQKYLSWGRGERFRNLRIFVAPSLSDGPWDVKNVWQHSAC